MSRFQKIKQKNQKKILQKQIDETQKKLVSEKHRLENDIDYIEKLAREKYRMAKPGEKVFKVIDSNKKTNK